MVNVEIQICLHKLVLVATTPLCRQLRVLFDIMILHKVRGLFSSIKFEHSGDNFHKLTKVVFNGFLNAKRRQILAQSHNRDIIDLRNFGLTEMYSEILATLKEYLRMPIAQVLKIMT
jgi:hypothetical protein